MSSFRYALEIFAPPERVWEALLQIENWPEWTPTVTRLERLDSGPLALGSRARIWQPGLMTNTWRVTALDPHARLFVWEASRPGVRVIARHLVGLAPGGSTYLTLELLYRGLLGAIMAVRLKHLNWEYLTKEAQGLKAFCESYLV